MNKDIPIDSKVKLVHINQADDYVINGIESVLSDDKVYRYLPFQSPPNKEEVLKFLNHIMNMKSIIWSITYNHKIIGIIDLINIKNGSASLAYFLGKQYHGQGIVAAAISNITKFAFNELKLSKVTAPVVSRNGASKRVLEKNNFLFHKKSDEKVNFDGKVDEVQLFILKKS